ncbi:MAG: acyl carrier protein [Bacillati bacterium ANGP1]|uniref:Acyl carrier protein n=1 Tax=Candidatus Segetimicrobium genomatis TaxID=2569760 RepID=A0A537LDZ7_9BACT|nr:MAG: acyl carrier protein [Terrabacteria group bacterium ANGP1]TMJ13507.1 MAG: acyl carrier protein [Terrabacteria group bacterium ANGP1]
MPDATAVVEARVAQILARALHLEIPSADLDLFETGAIDSLAFVEFLLHLEREFGIAVPLEELELDNFRTIRRIAQFVNSRNGAQPHPGHGGTEPPSGPTISTRTNPLVIDH